MGLVPDPGQVQPCERGRDGDGKEQGVAVTDGSSVSPVSPVVWILISVYNCHS